MSKHYTYRWGAGCESALIEGPGLGPGREVRGRSDRQLEAMCADLDRAYEAGVLDGGKAEAAVKQLVEPAPFIWPDPAEATISTPPVDDAKGYTIRYKEELLGRPLMDYLSELSRTMPTSNDHIEFGRGWGKKLATHLAYMEELIVRSIYHEVTGEEPTDEAMKGRVSRVPEPGGNVAYWLHVDLANPVINGTLLVRKLGYGPITLGKVTQLYESP